MWKNQTQKVFKAVPTWAKNHTDISVLPMKTGTEFKNSKIGKT